MLYDPRWHQNRTTEPWRIVLRNAADLLKRIGWVQGHSGNETVGFCASMAIRFAAYDLDLNLEYPGQAWTEAAMRFCRFVGAHYIPDYNDEPGQTEDKIVAVLLACAEQ